MGQPALETTIAEKWYIARDKQKLGPYSSDQIKLRASNGELQPTEMVWKEGMQQWVPASRIKSPLTDADTLDKKR